MHTIFTLPGKNQACRAEKTQQRRNWIPELKVLGLLRESVSPTLSVGTYVCLHSHHGRVR